MTIYGGPRNADRFPCLPGRGGRGGRQIPRGVFRDVQRFKGSWCMGIASAPGGESCGTPPGIVAVVVKLELRIGNARTPGVPGGPP